MMGNKGAGTLYVVSTPLGNLEDITLRALKVLKDVDVIAAEGVQHTRALCRHYGIKSRLIGYSQHNRKVRTPDLLGRLKSGSDIALVTNAGTPGVSDPGAFLIRRALDENIRVSPVPGPSAVTAALSVSGLRGDSFLFLGFLAGIILAGLVILYLDKYPTSGSEEWIEKSFLAPILKSLISQLLKGFSHNKPVFAFGNLMKSVLSV